MVIFQSKNIKKLYLRVVKTLGRFDPDYEDSPLIFFYSVSLNFGFLLKINWPSTSIIDKKVTYVFYSVIINQIICLERH